MFVDFVNPGPLDKRGFGNVIRMVGGGGARASGFLRRVIVSLSSKYYIPIKDRLIMLILTCTLPIP